MTWFFFSANVIAQLSTSFAYNSFVSAMFCVTLSFASEQEKFRLSCFTEKREEFNYNFFKGLIRPNNNNNNVSTPPKIISFMLVKFWFNYKTVVLCFAFFTLKSGKNAEKRNREGKFNEWKTQRGNFCVLEMWPQITALKCFVFVLSAGRKKRSPDSFQSHNNKPMIGGKTCLKKTWRCSMMNQRFHSILVQLLFQAITLTACELFFSIIW